MNYKGKGEHSVNDLENLVEILKENNLKLQLKIQNLEQTLKNLANLKSMVSQKDTVNYVNTIARQSLNEEY